MPSAPGVIRQTYVLRDIVHIVAHHFHDFISHAWLALGGHHSLANRLRVARAERALSQEDLARLAGVTRQTISSIETGQYCPSALLAFQLALALDQPIAQLFFLEMKGDSK